MVRYITLVTYIDAHVLTVCVQQSKVDHSHVVMPKQNGYIQLEAKTTVR